MGIFNLQAVYDGKYTYKSGAELIAAGFRTDGVYLIDLPSVGPTYTFCLLDSKWDGGGWMMAMKAAATGTTFNYGANYWTTDNTLNATSVTQSSGDAKFEVMNKFAAKDIMARWPDISTNGGSIANTGTWTWMENNFNNSTRQTLISFFTTPSNRTLTSGAFGGSGYFIKDAKTFSGWQSGVFSSQTDIRFYGFNYASYPGPQYNQSAKVRWGFGWNENGEGLFPGVAGAAPGSNDISGGIGMDSNYGSYSAGDKINCCADTTGINRQARVEIYVR